MPMSGTNRNKSHKKILNKSGPRIEPCGIPKSITLQGLIRMSNKNVEVSKMAYLIHMNEA